jgi:hypothetical protein
MEHSATTVRRVKTKANAAETRVREGASAPRGIFRSRNRCRSPFSSFWFVSLTSSLTSAVFILFYPKFSRGGHIRPDSGRGTGLLKSHRPISLGSRERPGPRTVCPQSWLLSFVVVKICGFFLLKNKYINKQLKI